MLSVILANDKRNLYERRLSNAEDKLMLFKALKVKNNDCLRAD